jgi:hypothetical protein
MSKNKYWFIAFTYCLLPIAFALSLSLFIRRLPDVGQSRENTQIWVYKDHPISQTFTTQNNGLNVITVYLKNVSLRNQDPLVFRLLDKSNVIREITLSGYNVGDGDNVRFQFDPVLDSANHTYTFSFTSDSPQKSSIGVGYSSDFQSIAFQSYYHPTRSLVVAQTVTISFIRNLLSLKLIITFISLLLCLISIQKIILYHRIL